MAKSVEEAARAIPVLEEADVLVAGGGVAGCAAAWAAGMAGAIAAKAGLNAEDVPIRALQKTLLLQGAHLGTDERLRELGLT